MNNQRNLTSFQEFLKQRPKNKLNEDTLNIDVPWFQDCVGRVITELEIDLGIKDIEDLGIYVERRNSVLGIDPVGKCIEDLCFPFIKELVFRFSYGKSLQDDSLVSTPDQENKEEHLKAMIVDKIAREVIMIVRGKSSTNLQVLPPKLPQEPGCDPDYPGEYCVDLPTSYESKVISDYERFTKLLEKRRTKKKR